MAKYIVLGEFTASGREGFNCQSPPMPKETITMTARDQQRVHVLARWVAGEVARQRRTRANGRRFGSLRPFAQSCRWGRGPLPHSGSSLASGCAWGAGSRPGVRLPRRPTGSG